MTSNDEILLRLPKLWENMDEATIGKWLVSESDKVEKGQVIVELVTDKSTVEYESPLAGKVKALYAAEKSTLPINYILACIGPDEVEAPDVSAENDRLLKKHRDRSLAAGDTADVVSRAEQAKTQKLRVAPAARILARKNGVDLETIAERVGDRVVHRKDVQEFIESREEPKEGEPATKEPLALITGATGDIGTAISRHLAREGFQLALHYHQNRKQADMLCQEIRQAGGTAYAFQADLCDSAAANTLIDQVHTTFDRIDVLVNNAGALQDGLLSFMNDQQWHDVLDLNLNAAFYVTRATAMIMARQRRGKIVNIASDAGRMGGAGRCNYSAAKAGLAGFSRAIARELAASRIQVNTVSPGFIESRMTGDLAEAKRKELLRSIPARRLGSPEDVAELVGFLVSEAANYITGQDISVDGGLYMG